MSVKRRFDDHASEFLTLSSHFTLSIPFNPNVYLIYDQQHAPSPPANEISRHMSCLRQISINQQLTYHPKYLAFMNIRRNLHIALLLSSATFSGNLFAIPSYDIYEAADGTLSVSPGLASISQLVTLEHQPASGTADYLLNVVLKPQYNLGFVTVGLSFFDIQPPAYPGAYDQVVFDAGLNTIEVNSQLNPAILPGEFLGPPPANNFIGYIFATDDSVAGLIFLLDAPVATAPDNSISTFWLSGLTLGGICGVARFKAARTA
jgi:hypothetical protein